MVGAIQAGHIPNHAPLGFKRDNKKLVPDPMTKDIVIRVYDLYLEGKSYQAIANIYNKEKDLVSEQLKECHDNYLYSEYDINKIVKDTSKEIELTNYIEEKDYDYF